jgi:hypothetical protein
VTSSPATMATLTGSSDIQILREVTVQGRHDRR